MRINKEMDCASDSLVYGLKELAKGKLHLAAFHLENAARSLKEIEQLKEEQADGKVFLIGNVLGRRNPFG